MNLDLNQVNYGIGQGNSYRRRMVQFPTDRKQLIAGQLTLRNLRLKKGVLDKFQLPVDVVEGRSIAHIRKGMI